MERKRWAQTRSSSSAGANQAVRWGGVRFFQILVLDQEMLKGNMSAAPPRDDFASSFSISEIFLFLRRREIFLIPCILSSAFAAFFHSIIFFYFGVFLSFLAVFFCYVLRLLLFLGFLHVRFIFFVVIFCWFRFRDVFFFVFLMRL